MIKKSKYYGFVENLHNLKSKLSKFGINGIIKKPDLTNPVLSLLYEIFQAAIKNLFWPPPVWWKRLLLIQIPYWIL